MTEQADISKGRKLSGIWIIPLLALVLGAYMVIHTWMTQGPEIEIAFKTAKGLEQGKTKIRYRNVDMGLVEGVRLNDDFDGVIASVKLDRQALSLLRDDTRFWAVTARVGGGEISGLDTLLSGAYIQLSPGVGQEGQREFIALEQPPLTPLGAPGLRLKLISEESSSVTAGDSVIYNGYQVGRVESMAFDPEVRKARYVIFIDAPYHQLVSSATRFWDASGISLSAGTEGIKLETGSIDTILLGGVAFGVPPGIRNADPVEHNAEFQLHASHADILKNPFRYGTYYVVSFVQSIKGLQPGAPVEYRGISIGRVERILLRESIDESARLEKPGMGEPISVLIYLEPGRIELPDTLASVESLKSRIRSGVGNGLRASMETGNLLTGAKLISIDYFANAEPASMSSFMEFPAIPTIESGLGQIEQKLTTMLDKINALPLDETVSGMNSAIVSFDQTLGNLNSLLGSQGAQQLPAQLNQALKELQVALNGLSPDSDAYQSITSSLLRLNRTLSNLESLSHTLSRQPSAVILPLSPIPDPVPEARE